MARETREFTSEEIARINEIKSNNLENLSADDVQLYSDWETEWALRDTELQAELDSIQDELNAKKEAIKTEHDCIMQYIADMQAAAMARLERIENNEV